MNLILNLTQDEVRKIIADGYGTDIENVTVKHIKRYEGYYNEEELIELSIQISFPNSCVQYHITRTIFIPKPQKDR